MSDLSSSPFQCYSCIVGKSEARYPMNLALISAKNMSRFEKRNKQMEAKNIII